MSPCLPRFLCVVRVFVLGGKIYVDRKEAGETGTKYYYRWLRKSRTYTDRTACKRRTRYYDH